MKMLRTLPCGCVLHRIRTTKGVLYCATEGTPFCTFQCPHDERFVPAGESVVPAPAAARWTKRDTAMWAFIGLVVLFLVAVINPEREANCRSAYDREGAADVGVSYSEFQRTC